MRTRQCTSTVLHGMAGAVGANVAGHLLGVGGYQKLNLAGCSCFCELNLVSCFCELNLVSQILYFLTLKTGFLFDPKNGVRDTAFNGSIIETCNCDPKTGVTFWDRIWGQRFTDFFAKQLGFKSMVSQTGLRGKCRQSFRRRTFCEYHDQGMAQYCTAWPAPLPRTSLDICLASAEIKHLTW